MTIYRTTTWPGEGIIAEEIIYCMTEEKNNDDFDNDDADDEDDYDYSNDGGVSDESDGYGGGDDDGDTWAGIMEGKGGCG